MMGRHTIYIRALKNHVNAWQPRFTVELQTDQNAANRKNHATKPEIVGAHT